MSIFQAKPIDTIVISDTHINSTFGLCPPIFKRKGGGNYAPGPEQAKLRRALIEIVETKIKPLAVGREIIAVFNGDTFDIDGKNRTTKNITQDHDEIIEAGYDALEPVIKIASRIYVHSGTLVHDGNLEHKFGKDIGAEKTDGLYATQQTRKIFGKYRFDIAHHIKGNTANCVYNLARRILESCSLTGEEPPNFVVRSHIHRVFDTGFDFPSMRVVTTPCFQLRPDYLFGFGAESEPEQIGLLYFRDGDIKCFRVPYERREWKSG